MQTVTDTSESPLTEGLEPAARASAPLYGVGGLCLSLVAFAVLSVVVFVVAMLAVGGIDVLVNDREHLTAALRQALDSLSGGRLQEILVPVLVVTCIFYAAAVLALLALARFRGAAAWRDMLAWRPFHVDGVYVWLVVASIAYGALAGLAVQYFYPDAKSWFHVPPGMVGLAVTFLLAALLAPLAEELLFRGWLYTHLRAYMGFGPTLALTSVLFALAHWERTHLYALAVLPVGVVLGYLRERTGSVRATILLHGIYNAAALGLKLLFPDA